MNNQNRTQKRNSPGRNGSDKWSEMRTFCFTQPDISLPRLTALEIQWAGIPGDALRKAVCAQHQYYLFHLEILDNLAHRSPAAPGGACKPLGLSVRAGALKTLWLLVGAIAEAVLQAHATKRGLVRPGENPRFTDTLKTLGKGDGNLAETLRLADQLRKARNDVHLYKAVATQRDFKKILAEEARQRQDASRLLLLLQSMRS